MSSFVQVDHPVVHPGVARAEAAIEYVREVRRGFSGGRGLAVLLLAAIVSSLLVVADKLMSSWNEGSLLAAWLVMWVVAFVALALFADTARAASGSIIGMMRSVARHQAARRADAQLMAYAKADPRILRDLQAIVSHQEGEAIQKAAPVVAPRTRSRISLRDILSEANLSGRY